MLNEVLICVCVCVWPNLLNLSVCMEMNEGFH